MAIAQNPHPLPEINDYRATPGSVPAPVAEAAAEARAALSAFPNGTFSWEEQGALSNLQYVGPYMAQSRYERRQRELAEAHADFIRAARAELGSAGSNGHRFSS